jgi:hypothetical protein
LQSEPQDAPYVSIEIECDLSPRVDACGFSQVEERTYARRFEDMEDAHVLANIAIGSFVALVATFPTPRVDQVIAVPRVSVVERTGSARVRDEQQRVERRPTIIPPATPGYSGLKPKRLARSIQL